MEKGEKDGGWQLGHGVVCSLARKGTGLWVSQCESTVAQGSVFIDSYLRASLAGTWDRP